ncbi:2-methylisocitrate lyase-like PEP mutase family enzyme [Cryobacterium mesophilum]|uniref:Isocitrate lyase/phosphoenolpyruvate mutase family protein n=1 Tax=Terrimesophilobacter mesophilus TaxID=433647 RepID=A0A4R8V9H0_9MICO|nr:isocitrate lyase/phosphoenolpyruvate mutase family protein [Terrimesophilobacter mesophilus]MBB5633051.1 2-methylisocitrate lyase-like PEP mutase family enzyme [Terrimesophilobacter mesophilus]TFB79814.1 isocitrate lyase/phosphoenolpyruvate mutase family protein [Terrimesophilobacter mesophilus]
MTTTADKAEALRSLHVPGDPLIVVNVWDAITARTVAAVPGVRALATASHSISFAHGVPDGEGLSVDEALAAAKVVIDAVDLPVSVDFERGYSPDAAGVGVNVGRLIEVGAAGMNLEDSYGTGAGELFDIDDAAERVAAARTAADTAGVPIVINARVDALARGGEFDDAILRGNRYLAAGADVIFMLGLATEELVQGAIDALDGRLSVISGPTSVPLKRLAELGVSRVSFGPRPLGLVLSHLQDAAAVLTSRGDYPPELGFSY